MATSHDAPASSSGSDGRGREELANQVRFLEAEVHDLRRRLSDGPATAAASSCASPTRSGPSRR